MSAVLEAYEPSAKYLSALQPKLVQHFDLLGSAPGGVAKLRELILTLAVQGKLVPQDPSDAPATELLKDIQAEKDRLIAAKILKRERDEPALTEDALPFELPASWSWAALGAVIDIVRGITFPATHKTKEAAPGRIACLRTSNVQHTIKWDDLLFVERSFMGREEQLIQHHDIVMSMANSRELVGKVALIDQIPHPEATFGGFLGVLRPRKIDPRYAMAVLRTPYARAMLIDSSSQTTNIANVSLAKLRPLPFPLPPADEQSRIVARVEELMRLCDALETKGQLEAAQHAQLVQTLLGALTTSTSPEDLADNWQRVAVHFDLLFDRPEAIGALEQTILQLAVRGLLVPQDPNDELASVLLHRIQVEQDFDDVSARKKGGTLPEVAYGDELYKVPGGWEWVRIAAVAEVVGGIQKTQLRRPVQQHYPYLRVANVQRDVLRLDEIERFELTVDELNKWRLRTGDLLIVEGNGSADEIGRCAVWDGSIDPCVYQNHLIRVRCHERALIAFIKLFLNSPSGAQEMRRLAITSSGLFNLSVGKIRNYVIPMPPLAEQTRIVARVESLRRHCTDLRQRLAASQLTQAHLAEALIDEVA